MAIAEIMFILFLIFVVPVMILIHSWNSANVIYIPIPPYKDKK